GQIGRLEGEGVAMHEPETRALHPHGFEVDSHDHSVRAYQREGHLNPCSRGATQVEHLRSISYDPELSLNLLQLVSRTRYEALFFRLLMVEIFLLVFHVNSTTVQPSPPSC